MNKMWPLSYGQPVTKLDRLLFARLGWRLVPNHARVLRLVAGAGQEGLTYQQVRRALPGTSYSAARSYCEALERARVFERASILAADGPGGRQVRVRASAMGRLLVEKEAAGVLAAHE